MAPHCPQNGVRGPFNGVESALGPDPCQRLHVFPMPSSYFSFSSSHKESCVLSFCKLPLFPCPSVLIFLFSSLTGTSIPGLQSWVGYLSEPIFYVLYQYQLQWALLTPHHTPPHKKFCWSWFQSRIKDSRRQELFLIQWWLSDAQHGAWLLESGW